MTKNNSELASLARRRALQKMGGLTACGLLPGLSGLLSMQSAEAAGSYKALVCVFLFGGNDANNMIVPTDSSNYATYLAARGGIVGTPSNGALALPNAGQSGGVLQLAALNGTSYNYGLHPGMPELQNLWGSGNVALLFNVGNLVQPFSSAAAFLANQNANLVPLNLYSHSDQQRQMQMTSLNTIGTTGWGGRLADSINSSGKSIPATISAAGNALFLLGAQSAQIVVPGKGTMSYNGFNSSSTSQARLSALKALFGGAPDTLLAQTLGATQSASIGTADTLSPILSNAAVKTLSGNFTDYSTNTLSQQLTQVAALIQAASSGAISAPAQQIFFVSLNGFDTHNDQLNRQAPLLANLSSALNGFYKTMVSMNQHNNVVAFTLSDFARTLKPASGGGSDHAWGSHHIIVGGSAAVKGGTYGNFPNLTLAGASDVSAEGRWLPTTSVDQYGATLANWLGANASAIGSAFPNLVNFSTANLGFLT